MRQLEPGQYVGLRYRVVELLGQGGMGMVYRARHLGFDIDVALKVLPGELVVGQGGQRFEREARAAARLHHRGCVRVFDFGRTLDGDRYLAMELVEGPSLGALLDAEGALPVARAVGIAREILRALAHAHRANVIHRDIKPTNVMFTTDEEGERAVLIDFGLARALDDAALTATGMCVGSPSYLAPERLIGDQHDARADLYSVGIVLFEMLAGERPFVAGTPTEIALQQIERRPPSLCAVRSTIPYALDAVIARALAKDPADRFADAAAMISALDAVLLPTVTPPAPARARPYLSDVPTIEMDIDLPLRRSLRERVFGWLT